MNAAQSSLDAAALSGTDSLTEKENPHVVVTDEEPATDSSATSAAISSADEETVADGPRPWWFYLIFAASGFAALIYESLWTRYLKVFLGHAAYAQTLVLVIFLFGIAIGSVIAARHTKRISRPMLVYAAVEAIVAFVAVYFHDIFVITQSWALDSILPQLSGLSGATFKWLLAAFLILPQTILLGTTFPLLAASMTRRWPQKPGRTIALLYFNNSIGAAAGVLASGFIFIPFAGLPGAGLVAGIINAAIALIVWVLCRRFGEVSKPFSAIPTAIKPVTHVETILYVTAAVTGMASFIYEIVWIRFISQLLGASVNSLEIMLSVFIAGLAIGGLVIRRYADRTGGTLPLLAAVQIVMGVLALASLFVYPQLFKIYASLWQYLQGDDAPLWYGLLGFLLAVLLIFPTALCAGMTLPLITRHLMEQRGESSLGAVYAANTAGAIIGVLLAVHFLLPQTGAQNAMLAGAAADLLLGCALFVHLRQRKPALLSTLVTTMSVAGALLFGSISPHYAASGIYRYGRVALYADKDFLFYKDGKTSSIAVIESKIDTGRVVNILTNGKSDASFLYDDERPENYSADEMTMVMSGLLPLLVRPDAKRAANIGFGSGLTSRMLLQSPFLQQLDNIEIEPAIVAGARLMGDKNAPVFDDSRNHFIYDDAKAVFARTPEKYDIIVSEPSNPWLSGIGGLFTREFYARIKNTLAPRGVFVQWLPLYDSSPHIFSSVATALAEEFGNFRLYLSGSNDVIIVAVAEDEPPALKDAIFADDSARQFLESYGFRFAADAEALFLGDQRQLMPYFRSFFAPINSDYFPYLEYSAPAAFFRHSIYAWGLTQALPVPFMDMARARNNIPQSDAALPHSPISTAMARVRRLLAEHDDRVSAVYRAVHKLSRAACGKEREQEEAYMLSLSTFISQLLPYADTESMSRLWESLERRRCVKNKLHQDDRTAPGVYTKFWRALSLRDGQGVIDATDALLPAMDLYSETGQIVALAAMAGHYQQGNYPRVIALINQLPPIDPVIHHAARFLSALAADAALKEDAETRQ